MAGILWQYALSVALLVYGLVRISSGQARL